MYESSPNISDDIQQFSSMTERTRLQAYLC